MPDIQTNIADAYADQDVLVLGLHQGESGAQLEDFRRQTGVTFPFVADQNTLGKFAWPSGVGYPYPRDIVIGKDLTVHSIKNSFDVAEMDALIQKLLAEEP